MNDEPKLLTAVLEQTEQWRDGSGVVHDLATMDRDHRRRIEPFLLRKGERLRWSWLLLQSGWHHAEAPVVLGVVNGRDVESRQTYPLWSDDGGNMDRAFDEWIDFEMDRPLAEWLADRPLVKRLRELDVMVDGPAWFDA